VSDVEEPPESFDEFVPPLEAPPALSSESPDDPSLDEQLEAASESNVPTKANDNARR